MTDRNGSQNFPGRRLPRSHRAMSHRVRVGCAARAFSRSARARCDQPSRFRARVMAFWRSSDRRLSDDSDAPHWQLLSDTPTASGAVLSVRK